MSDFEKTFMSAYKNERPKHFTLKEGLNFANPANDYRNDTMHEGLTIDSIRLVDDEIDQMFNDQLKGKKFSKSSDVLAEYIEFKKTFDDAGQQIVDLVEDYVKSSMNNQEYYSSIVKYYGKMVPFAKSMGTEEPEDILNMTLLVDFLGFAYNKAEKEVLNIPASGSKGSSTGRKKVVTGTPIIGDTDTSKKTEEPKTEEAQKVSEPHSEKHSVFENILSSIKDGNWASALAHAGKGASDYFNSKIDEKGTSRWDAISKYVKDGESHENMSAFDKMLASAGRYVGRVFRQNAPSNLGGMAGKIRNMVVGKPTDKDNSGVSMGENKPQAKGDPYVDAFNMGQKSAIDKIDGSSSSFKQERANTSAAPSTAPTVSTKDQVSNIASRIKSGASTAGKVISTGASMAGKVISTGASTLGNKISTAANKMDSWTEGEKSKATEEARNPYIKSLGVLETSILDIVNNGSSDHIYIKYEHHEKN